MNRLVINFNYPTRAKLALFLLVSSFLLSSLHLLMRTITFDLSFVGNDEITLYEKRFENLRKMLPSQGVVTYLDDNKNFKEYYLTQYTLAPLILSNPKFPGL